ncbi:unnamed protein product [Oikopleura dioica]|uniref:Uncharacterized protein n=1 Tax=Oikopleura dioica TaxID=34765 RepID=E4Z5Q3_OIKDI|nr:unnamed protein product [Oikopleura dioica]
MRDQINERQSDLVILYFLYWSCCSTSARNRLPVRPEMCVGTRTVSTRRSKNSPGASWSRDEPSTRTTESLIRLWSKRYKC